ncbi:hypothetical protein DFH09DRAFT_1084680 [Mycena vulgaris]|nr:hypothetical protein DFH09DRAFT_1084680 [Mycena vulgaris]
MFGQVRKKNIILEPRTEHQLRSGPQPFPEPVFGFGFGFGFGSGPESDLNLTVATLGGTKGVNHCRSAFVSISPTRRVIQDGNQAQFIRFNFKNRFQIDTDAGAPDFGPDFGRNGQPSGPGNDVSWRQVGASRIGEHDNPSPYDRACPVAAKRDLEPTLPRRS